MVNDPRMSPTPVKVYAHQHQLQLNEDPLASVCVVVTRANHVEVSWTSNTEPMRASLLLAEAMKVLINYAIKEGANPAKQSLIVPVGDLPLPPFPGPASHA